MQNLKSSSESQNGLVKKSVFVFFIVWFVAHIGINIVISYAYEEFNTDYTKLFIVTSFIPAIFMSILYILAFMYIKTKLLFSENQSIKSSNYLLIKKIVIIVSLFAVGFGFFKCFSSLPVVHNDAILNNLTEDRAIVEKIISQFESIHIVSTIIYTTISIAVLYVTTFISLKKLNHSDSTINM